MTVIAIGSDHAAIDQRMQLVEKLKAWGHEVLDVGTHERASCDYPVFANLVCNAVLSRRATFGILMCGSGVGMSMAANRHKAIRAALCTHEYTARMTRAHNDANVLCLGARVTGPDLIEAIAKAFLETPFEGGRHQRRIDLFSEPL